MYTANSIPQDVTKALKKFGTSEQRGFKLARTVKKETLSKKLLSPQGEDVLDLDKDGPRMPGGERQDLTFQDRQETGGFSLTKRASSAGQRQVK